MPIGSARRMRYAVIAGLFAVAALSLDTLPSAVAVDGQTLYASPTGSGTDCSQTAPCNVNSAVLSAPSGSTVILEPGTYTSDTTIRNDTDGGTYRSITVEGQAGKPRPTINTDADYGVLLVNSVIERVTINHSGTVGALDVVNGAASQVYVSSAAPWTCELLNATLADSVCRNLASSNGAAVLGIALGGESTSATVTNVTAICDGPDDDAILAQATGQSETTLTMDNTIAMGGRDAARAEARDHSVAEITGNHNIADGNGSGGDGTSQADTRLTDPIVGNAVFVGAASGDYHEAAGSPSIDAGARAVASGSVDLDGLPRVLGTGPDVGAYEFALPPTADNAHLTKHSGKHSLHAVVTVNDQGVPAVARLVAKHGGTTVTGPRESVDASTDPQKVTLALHHLNRHVHYEITATVTDAAGTASQPVG